MNTGTKTLFRNLLDESSANIDEDDLPVLQKKYIEEINTILTNSPGKIISELRDFRERIVVIGDIHNDYYSLLGIFSKLQYSDYNYLEKAVFVFLGDYIDRGRKPLNTLLFLLGLKNSILKERCIFLRGNHDGILYDEDKNTFFSNVKPAETVNLFNKYFKKETILRIKELFESFPYMAYLEREAKKILFVHGGIPKDSFLQYYDFSVLRGMTFSMMDENIKKMLYMMLWSDPADADYKMESSETRFEFGVKQFDKFLSLGNYTHLIRAHVPQKYGIQKMYNDRLITVHSTGGKNNGDSYYSDGPEPYPAFMIIDEAGEFRPESTFVYKITTKDNNDYQEYLIEKDTASLVLKLRLPGYFSNSRISTNHFYLNDEFALYN